MLFDYYALSFSFPSGSRKAIGVLNHFLAVGEGLDVASFKPEKAEVPLFSRRTNLGLKLQELP